LKAPLRPTPAIVAENVGRRGTRGVAGGHRSRAGPGATRSKHVTSELQAAWLHVCSGPLRGKPDSAPATRSLRPAARLDPPPVEPSHARPRRGGTAATPGQRPGPDLAQVGAAPRDPSRSCAREIPHAHALGMIARESARSLQKRQYFFRGSGLGAAGIELQVLLEVFLRGSLLVQIERAHPEPEMREREVGFRLDGFDQ